MSVQSGTMKVRAIADHESNPIALEGAKGVLMRMLVGPDDGAKNFHMRHVTVEAGGYSPHHQHDYEHEVLILKGSGVLRADDGDKPFKSNDAIFVPANDMHQFRNTGDGPLEFICLIPAPMDCSK